LTGVVLVGASSLAILALLAFAASAFAKRELEDKEVELELDVQKIDPYGWLLAYVYLPNGEMINETLLRDGFAQVATSRPT